MEFEDELTKKYNRIPIKKLPQNAEKKKLATNKVEASSQPCKRKQANIRNPKENDDAQRQTRNRVKASPYI
jgi:hypothetical protein